MGLWYITFVSVLKTALSVGLCISVYDSPAVGDSSTTKYWAVDTSLKCYEGDHLKLLYFVVLAYACPVYGGLLILFGIFLSSPVECLKDKNGWVYETMGFLYRSYRLGRRRYWEVAVVARKVSIAFLVFCAHLFDSVLPITGLAHFIILAIVAQIATAPYRRRFEDLNRFEVVSLFASLVTTLTAAMLKEEDFTDNTTRELLTAACVLLNLVVFIVFAYHILKFVVEYLKQILREGEDDADPDAGVFGVLPHWMSYEYNHLMNRFRRRRGQSENLSSET